MTLDISTLFTLLVVVAAMAAMFVWFLSIGHHSIPGIRSFAFSNTFLFIGLTLIALRAVLPPILSFVVANIIVCIGYTLILHGVGKFFRRRVSNTVLCIAIICYSFEFTYYFMVNNQYNIRLFFYLIYYAAVMAFALFIILQEYRKVRLVSHLAAALFIGLLSLTFTLIAAAALSQTNAAQIFSPSAINAAVVLGQLIFVIGWTFSFTLLVSERLNDERVRAETSSREKSEALANMSHELRTPLNAIIGFADVIDQEALGPDNPRYKDYVKDILASGRHLLLLIEDILDISKIEAGKLELAEQEVDIAALVEAVRHMVMLKATAKSIALMTKIDGAFLRMRGDDLRLRQILLNIVSNAVKFTPDGGRVLVSTHLASDGTGRFIVADTGIGMDKAGMERALSKYCQVENSQSRLQEGIGLGLPLAVALTEAHGGRLAIDSTKDKGTTITVEFPAQRCVF
ncbi:hypothetical protein CU669_01090 [Paramagnetospirillum kuznetsovii]|uniref:histidine kinase n=1 Tax=Paramagnetospirillum kuznetsovii TaxID=2053833 RepID=A0A364P2Y4_9PROT|nr:ATP-binding protein [Paramagnetospirillum kuznetsovii]RAU23728.1 hypothetical protein CU669_01090 [Paramagnetospirillum kuznetsovii]